MKTKSPAKSKLKTPQNSPLKSKIISSFLDVNENPFIRILDLSNQNLTTFKGLKNYPNLRILNLSGNPGNFSITSILVAFRSFHIQYINDTEITPTMISDSFRYSGIVTYALRLGMNPEIDLNRRITFQNTLHFLQQPKGDFYHIEGNRITVIEGAYQYIWSILDENNNWKLLKESSNVYIRKNQSALSCTLYFALNLSNNSNNNSKSFTIYIPEPNERYHIYATLDGTPSVGNFLSVNGILCSGVKWYRDHELIAENILMKVLDINDVGHIISCVLTPNEGIPNTHLSSDVIESPESSYNSLEIVGELIEGQTISLNLLSYAQLAINSLTIFRAAHIDEWELITKIFPTESKNDDSNTTNNENTNNENSNNANTNINSSNTNSSNTNNTNTNNTNTNNTNTNNTNINSSNINNSNTNNENTNNANLNNTSTNNTNLNNENTNDENNQTTNNEKESYCANIQIEKSDDGRYKQKFKYLLKEEDVGCIIRAVFILESNSSPLMITSNERVKPSPPYFSKGILIGSFKVGMPIFVSTKYHGGIQGKSYIEWSNDEKNKLPFTIPTEKDIGNIITCSIYPIRKDGATGEPLILDSPQKIEQSEKPLVQKYILLQSNKISTKSQSTPSKSSSSRQKLTSQKQINFSRTPQSKIKKNSNLQTISKNTEINSDVLDQKLNPETFHVDFGSEKYYLQLKEGNIIETKQEVDWYFISDEKMVLIGHSHQFIATLEHIGHYILIFGEDFYCIVGSVEAAKPQIKGIITIDSNKDASNLQANYHYYGGKEGHSIIQWTKKSKFQPEKIVSFSKILLYHQSDITEESEYKVYITPVSSFGIEGETKSSDFFKITKQLFPSYLQLSNKPIFKISSKIFANQLIRIIPQAEKIIPSSPKNSNKSKIPITPRKNLNIQIDNDNDNELEFDNITKVLLLKPLSGKNEIQWFINDKMLSKGLEFLPSFEDIGKQIKIILFDKLIQKSEEFLLPEILPPIPEIFNITVHYELINSTFTFIPSYTFKGGKDCSEISLFILDQTQDNSNSNSNSFTKIRH